MLTEEERWNTGPLFLILKKALIFSVPFLAASPLQEILLRLFSRSRRSHAWFRLRGTFTGDK
jgi:hypothetical protein